MTDDHNAYDHALAQDERYREARKTHNGCNSSYHIPRRAETPLWAVAFIVLVVPAVALASWVML